MSSCAECFRAACLRSDAIELLERRGVAPGRAGELLKGDPAALFKELGPADAVEVDDLGGCWAICRHDDAYPMALTAFERESDIPHVIFGRGDQAVLGEAAAGRAIALVGARRASAYGREVAYQLACEAAASGLTVVSGMALGIDGAAHRGALQGGGPTIAVLAGGPDRAYPRSHRLLYDQIVERGCVISENPPGSEARRWAFVARNRIIAALSELTVWVEGSESSGARHTVEFADQLGRLVGVVPGPVTSPMSAGPNRRLGDAGVIPVLGIDDLLESLDLAFLPRARTRRDVDHDPETQTLLELVASGHRTPRSLSEQLSGSSPREISQQLGLLELSGILLRDSSGEYRRA